MPINRNLEQRLKTLEEKIKKTKGSKFNFDVLTHSELDELESILNFQTLNAKLPIFLKTRAEELLKRAVEHNKIARKQEELNKNKRDHNKVLEKFFYAIYLTISDYDAQKHESEFEFRRLTNEEQDELLQLAEKYGLDSKNNKFSNVQDPRRWLALDQKRLLELLQNGSKYRDLK